MLNKTRKVQEGSGFGAYLAFKVGIHTLILLAASLTCKRYLHGLTLPYFSVEILCGWNREMDCFVCLMSESTSKLSIFPILACY